VIRDTLLSKGLTDTEILMLFRHAQRDLIAVIERADPSRPFGAYRSQHLREIDRIVLLLERNVSRWSKREIGALMRAGADETAEEIRGFKEKQFAFRFGGLNEEAVRVLTDGSLMEFGNTMLALRKNATKALIDKKKLHEKIIEGVIQGSSVARTERQLVDLFKKQGITVLKAKNGFGRRFSLEHYANTLVRSQSMAAYNLGAKRVMVSTGRRFAKIPKLVPDIDGDDICNHFEEQVYIDLNDPTQLPPFHPNCRHVPVPVSFAELKANRPDLYKQAVRFFNEG
jgi:hypothetical protein